MVEKAIGTGALEYDWLFEKRVGWHALSQIGARAPISQVNYYWVRFQTKVLWRSCDSLTLARDEEWLSRNNVDLHEVIVTMVSLPHDTESL